MLPLILVFAFVIGGILFLVAMSHRRGFKLTSTIAGTVTRSEERELVRDQTRMFETDVECQYTIAGKTYDLRRTIGGRQARRLRPGVAVVVRYNPADPSEADLG